MNLILLVYTQVKNVNLSLPHTYLKIIIKLINKHKLYFKKWGFENNI